ncbi:transcription factor bHLH112-like [Salvia hispanica]|uniref:transcription factor bHLH112-like n=1 Tax=Salvia hispanica TaxID=49212 RepID=UPI0020093570|nr:transcription factor bHLH112-like [Salvia hispanica]
MAEELISWWNSPRNLFSSSPCSLASNDIGSLGWPTETRSVRSSDESDGSSTLLIQDVHHHHPKLDAWNQPLPGRSEDNHSNFLVDSSMNYRADQMNFSEEESSMKQSSLLQTLFDADSQPYPSLLDDQIQMNSNGFMPKPSPSPTADNSLWINPSALSNVRPPTSHFFPSPHNHSITAKATHIHKTFHEQPTFKRPRIETPSPLPTFKVRKEKLGDRITALQQLVSPFGKTDTASVLHEAIEYIKFLHDQVNSLSTPYLKYGSPPLQAGEKSKDEEGVTKGLKTQGLCLVPISSTFPVAAEATSDFWTPSFAGSFT